MDAVLPRLAAVLAENPDLASARLLSPRRLSENQAYHAFVVPTFETGRLAGIGADPDGAPHATQSAWETYAGRTDGSRMPYYHRWFFRTGTIGDFEHLVRLLKPRPADPRVGRREVDVLRPGAGLPPISDPDLHGVLRLGGALRVPEINLDEAARAEAETYERWDAPYPHPFQVAMAGLVNLGDDYATDGTADPDPLVAPPLYGRWHALTARLLTSPDGSPAEHRDKWLHELNLDPRFRLPAGFGTRVVQERQEELMAAAWEQVGDILEANRRIRLGQVAREVARRWHMRALDRRLANTPARVVALTAPLHARVLADGVTVAHRMASGPVATAPVSAPMRRIVRPRSRLVRALPFSAASPPDALLEKIASKQVSAAPPKVAPAGAATVADVADELRPGVPRPILDALVRVPWLRWLLLLLALLVLLLGVLAGGAVLVACVAVAVVLVLLWWLTGRWRAAAVAANAVDEGAGPQAVDDLPHSPDFHLSDPAAGFRPEFGSSDSEEAVRFKAGCASCC